MGLLDAFRDKQFWTDVADNTAQLGRAASDAVASNVTGPVDLTAWALRKAGLPIPDAPVGGSDWAKARGLLNGPQPTQSAQIAGETLGLLAPTMIASKAPQIASGLLQMGENAVAPRVMNPQAGAIVWHGSPHKFDKFDASKIGTGEGAQAYGHGLYLAENPGVARDYRNKLSQNITPLDASFGDTSLAEAAQSFGDTGYAKAFANKYFQLLKNGKTEAQAKSQVLRALEKRVLEAKFPGDVKGAKEAIEFLNSGKAELSGSLYKVDLPDEHIAKMLDWDKPLSQQAPEVQRVLQSQPVADSIGKLKQSGQLGDYSTAEMQQLRGEDWYDMLRQAHGDSNVAPSEFLKKQGIPGIRYLDGGSRGTGAGTSNFVVFPGNEGLLQILERNGKKIGE